MYRITLTTPKDDKIINEEFTKIDNAVVFINETLFSGIPVLTTNVLSNIINRPKRVNSTYTTFIKASRYTPIRVIA